MDKKITVSEALTKGLEAGLKGFPSIVGCLVLWLLTCWIPYVNIGTTIAIVCLPLEMSKGNIISPLSIFDKKYFKYMGEFFLIVGFISIGIVSGYCLFIIPGIVISIAWSLAILLMIDKEVNPIEALAMSNKATSGYKWTIFLIYFLAWIVLVIVSVIAMSIPFIGIFLSLIIMILVYPVIIGIGSYIYSKLSSSKE
jgi:hypothetical protein